MLPGHRSRTTCRDRAGERGIFSCVVVHLHYFTVSLYKTCTKGYEIQQSNRHGHKKSGYPQQTALNQSTTAPIPGETPDQTYAVKISQCNNKKTSPTTIAYKSAGECTKSLGMMLNLVGTWEWEVNRLLWKSQ